MSDQNDKKDEATEEIIIESGESEGSSDSSTRVKQLEEALQKAKSDHLYLMADFDNYKKRAIKERSDLMKYAGERAFVEILGALDSFELALKADLKAENVDTFKKGFEMIFQELKSVLERFGVQELPTEGVVFDPMVHEALGSEETEKVPAGSVFRVLRKPYKLHDRLIRPGQVIVSKEKSREKEEN